MHPCRPCGACCASLRVRFHEREVDRNGGTVPAALVVVDPPGHVVMRGTLGGERRCIALDGQVGVSTSCTIHPLRSSNCRAFDASWEHGVRNPHCDDVRLKHGIAPLTAQDWI